MIRKKIPTLFMVISALMFTGFSIPDSVFAVDEKITINSYESIIEENGRLFVEGTVDIRDDFYEPVIMTVYGPDKEIIYELRLSIEDTEFNTVLTPPIGAFDPGWYEIHASHTSIETVASMVFAVSDGPYENVNITNISPHKQLEMFSDSSKVICDKGLVLLDNLNRNSIACVTPISAIDLSERGWGQLI